MKKGWETKRLGEVCEVVAGQSPDGKFYNSEGKGLPFYQGKKEFGEKFINAPTTWTTQTTKIAKEGDILMSVRAPVGPVNVSTEEICIGRGLAAIRCGKQLSRDFLFYQFLHLQPDIAGKEGAVFASINKSEIEAMPVACAPLAEQRRIVAVLDEAFEGIATAKANAERNLLNAKAIFESHLQSVFTKRGPGWVETTLGDEVEFAAGYAFKSSGYAKSKEGTRLLRGDNIMQGEFRWEDSAYWPSNDTLPYDRFLLEENDIVLAMDRPLVSAGLKIACVSKRDLPCLQVQRTARMRVSSSLLWRYLFHLLRSQGFVAYLLDGQTGLGVPHISGKQILSFQFFRPSMTEQKQIVTQLDALSAETRRFASLYERKLAALEALKKSLLHRAFSGVL
jgi:type I restriction enzyme S subunit